MMTFFSFLPIIISAIFLVFCGYLLLSEDKEHEGKLKHHKHRRRSHKAA